MNNIAVNTNYSMNASSTMNSFSKKMYFESVPITTDLYPLTISKLQNQASRYGSKKLFFNPNVMAKYELEIRSATHGNFFFDGLTFSNHNDLITFINSNVPNNNQSFSDTFIIHTYNSLDNTIPQLSHVRGFNSLIGSLLGPGNTKKGFTAYTHNEKWSQAPALLKDIFDACHPFTANNTSISDFGPLSLGAGAIKVRNDNNFWYATNFSKNSGPLKVRGAYDASTNTLVPMLYMQPAEVLQPKVIVYDWIGHSWSIESFSDSWSQYVWSSLNNHSIILCYPIRFKTHYAVYAIPFGIDSIVLQYIDFEKYSIDVLYGNNSSTSNIIQVRDVDILRSSKEKNSLQLDSSAWKRDPFINNYLSTIDGSKFQSSLFFKFRLRDRFTNKVGSESRFKILLKQKPKTHFIVDYDK